MVTPTHTLSQSDGEQLPNDSSSVQASSDLEFEFILCLIRRVENAPQAEERIEEIAARNPDWSSIQHLAEKHGLVPLLNEAITELQLPVPKEIERAIQTQCRNHAVRNLQYINQLHLLTSKFREADLRVIPYKGPVIADLAYGDVSRRWFGDLDFLVATEDVVRACEILQQEGYHQTEFTGISPAKILTNSPFRWEGEFHFSDRDGTDVDIRNQFVGKSPEREDIVSDLWDRRSTVAVSGETIPALSPEDRILILLAHGTKHAWCRLSWTHDITLLLEQDVDWHVLLDRAAQYGWKTAVLLGLAVVASLATIDIPEFVREEIADNRRAHIGSSLICKRLTTDPTGESLDIDPWTTILLLNNTPREVLSELLDVIVSPWPIDYNWISLPPRYHSLYYLIRPMRILTEAVWR